MCKGSTNLPLQSHQHNLIQYKVDWMVGKGGWLGGWEGGLGGKGARGFEFPH